MVQLNNPPFSIQEAGQRNNDVFELFYSNWGFENFVGAQGSRWPGFTDPSIPVSLAAIAIGARSLVDRCWVTYNLQKSPSTQLPNSTDRPALPTERVRGISLDSPLLLAEPSNPDQVTNLINAIQAMTRYNPLYIWSQDIQNGQAGIPDSFPVASGLVNSTTYPTSYTDINGVVRTLGPSGGSDAQAQFVEPFLHLYLFLKAPTILPPTKRIPLMVGKDFTAPLFEGGTDKLVAQIATFGRKTVHLFITCSSTTYSVRVGALRVPPGPVNVGPVTVFEEPVDSSGGTVTANTPLVLTPCIQNGLYADFLNIYITTSDPTPTLSYRLTAYD